MGAVVYEASDRHWKPSELYEENGRGAAAIGKMEDPDIRRMLELRRACFTNFHFDRIADYFVNDASPEERAAIEDMGLVLLDVDGLVEGGYMRLLSDAREIFDASRGLSRKVEDGIIR